jgi:hypothetical protein
LKTQNDKFYAYLAELDGNYRKLATLLTRKAAAISEGDLFELDDLMNEEQAYLLITRGFDQRIAGFRKDAGYTGERLADIIAELPAAERDRFTALHARLSASLEEVRALNEKCQNLAQIKLHGVRRQLEEMERSGSVPRRPGVPPKPSGGKPSGDKPGGGKLSKSI